jgi:hypothetical protein
MTVCRYCKWYCGERWYWDEPVCNVGGKIEHRVSEVDLVTGRQSGLYLPIRHENCCKKNLGNCKDYARIPIELVGLALVILLIIGLTSTILLLQWVKP